MRVEEIDHMFNFTYEKSSKAIVEKASDKKGALLTKIEERKQRIKDIRKAYDITDEVLIDLLKQARANQRAAVMQYTSNAKVSKGGLTEEVVTVPAGVVNNLMTEEDFISGEKQQIVDLELIIRNLVDFPDERSGMEGKLRGHRLSKEELTYLGF